MIKNKKAFTLVELLVAMFILSMIAVMLVPNLLQSSEKNIFISQLKKTYNDVQQAMLLIISKNNGTLEGLCSGDNPQICFIGQIVGASGETINHNDDDGNEISTTIQAAQGFLEKNVSYSGNENLNTCNKKDIRKDPCEQRLAYKNRKPQYMNKNDANFKAHDENAFYAANLKTGAAISVVFNSNCDGSLVGENNNYIRQANPEYDSTLEESDDNQPYKDTAIVSEVCGYMEVDVNAGKAPNMLGKDIHFFWILPTDGLVPFGEIDDFECISIKAANGKDNDSQLGCTAEIINKGKITYY